MRAEHPEEGQAPTGTAQQAAKLTLQAQKNAFNLNIQLFSQKRNLRERQGSPVLKL